MTLADKSDIFKFQDPGSDEYPPHLSLGPNGKSEIPSVESASTLQIFDFMRLLDTGTLLLQVIPTNIEDFLHGDPGTTADTIQAVVDRERAMRAERRDVYSEPCIGDRDDWYSDAVFAQTEFTGVNPTSLTIITTTPWLARFKSAAAAQHISDVLDLLAKSESELYVSDCSYFRQAVGVENQQEPIQSADGNKWGCASVCVYHLLPTGALHPIGIVIDYRDSLAADSTTMPNSVTIFNKRLSPSSKAVDEETDWPWRFAKNCVQTSDWLRHELGVHLTNAHLIEESVIVACPLTLPVDHPVYQILEPHWLKTLSLNAAARSALIPGIAIPIAGMTAPQVYAFIKDAYKRFDWVAKYIPNDLDGRGFSLNDLSKPKFHNYAYARNMALMWTTLRTFVFGTLSSRYPTNDSVAQDLDLQTLGDMLRGEGQITSFPVLNTRDKLFDAVTMCIHIASPQHTSINYLQNYYQSFVIARPPALYTAPPQTLAELKRYKEADLLATYPLKHPRDYLLASHIGHLLSSTVAQDQNLPNFAQSVIQIAWANRDVLMEKVGNKLLADLKACDEVFKRHSKELDDQTKPYDVMDPGVTAVSILI